MASFNDLGVAVRGLGFSKYLKRIYYEINKDNVFTYASAMAYAWVFAVFPFFIFLLTLIPYIPDKYRAHTHEYLERLLHQSGMPNAVTTTVMSNVDEVMKNTRGGLLSFGLLLTLYAASGGMNTTMSALDQALNVKRFRPYLLKRMIAMLLTIFMCVGLVGVLIMFPVGSIITGLLVRNIERLPPEVAKLCSGPSLFLFDMARYLIGLVIMQLMINVLYHFGPSERGKMRLFTPGSVFVAVGWLATGFALRLYFDNFANYSKTYGAVAGMVIMLMVFYLDAIIILVGAEIDSELVVIRKELLQADQQRIIEPFIA